MGSACIMNKQAEECIQDIGGKPEETRQLGGQRLKWVDNIKTHLTEMGWGDMDRILSLRFGTGGGLL